MEGEYQYLGKKVKTTLRHIGENPYVFCMVLGLLLNFGVELLSRKSFISVCSYLLDRPVIFFHNSLIIAFTVSFALLTKRRVFAFSLLAIIWLFLGIVNSVVLVFRTTPFTAPDLLLLKSAYTVMGSYLTGKQIIFICIALCVLLGFIFLIFWKAPKRKERISYWNVAFYIGGLFLATYFSTLAGTQSGVLAEQFGNIGMAYMEYGFPYCFGNSLINTGIDKPADYSPQIVDELIIHVEKPIIHSSRPIVEEGKEEKLPNIIFLQLESFFDPAHIKGIEFSENPLPNFTYLRATYSSGYLSVPSVGAGTANTEFEVITGMDLDFFGPGEYPYKTILKETTCESIAYNLKEKGYKSHVLHNNDGTFYERNQVFPQLGFDSFTSLEYMDVKEYTEMGWAKDFVLTEEIQKSLKSTKELDMIYAISVQGHGSYPAEKLENPYISLIGEENNSLEYYVNQIYEMDLFLGELIAMLQKYPERVILAMYGDHLPGFELTEEDLTNGDIFQTEYIIWDNFGLEKKDRDLEAYQLSAYVLEQAGLYNGILTKYHQVFSGEENYLAGLKLLQYDMLYGDQEVYNGENPLKPSKLVMGTNPISVSYVTEEEGVFLVKGKNFTKYSHVSVNGTEIETIYNSPDTLLIHEALQDGDKITVYQAGKDSVWLSQTKEYIYNTDKP